MSPKDEEIPRQIDLLKTSKDVIPSNGSTIVANVRLTKLKAVRDVYGPTILCNICSERCLDEYYNCQICDFGNYDQCPNGLS
jgi:hypothetical protein